MPHEPGDDSYVPWRELWRNLHRDALSEEERRIVLDRQVQVASRLVPLSHIAHVLALVPIVLFVIPPSSFRVWWSLSAVALLAASTAIWLPRSAIPHRRAGRFDMALLTGESLVNGMLHSVLALYCYGRIDADGVLLLTAILSGILGAGALCLFTTSSAGMVWIGSMSLVTSLCFLTQGTHTFRVLTAVTWVYALVLAFGVLYQSASFARRCIAEHAAESRMRTVELLLDDVEGGARDWLWETDASGVLVNVSHRFGEALGTETRTLDGRNLADLVAPGDRGTSGRRGITAADLRRHLSSATPFRNVTIAVDVGGRRRHLSLTGTPIDAGGSDVAGWRGVASDITDAVRHETEINRLANSDELTGLANRHRFQRDLESRVARRRADGTVHLAIVDLDDFKSVNDALGHQAGDRLLAAVATRLASTAPASVTCSRIGGDEFALVTSDDAAADWQHYLDALREPFAFEDRLLHVAACIGHATVPTDAGRVEDLVVAADLALYQAKDEGPSAVRAFDRALLTAARSKVATRLELAEAIDEDQFVIHLQPQVTTEDDEVIGFEVLLRWEHPTRGLLQPAEFIPVAEQSGLIVPIGERVMALACQAARQLPDSVQVALNVSAAQLGVPHLVERFAAIAASAGVAFDRLGFEVTESVLVDEAAIAVLAELRDVGATISVDDFGTGYSSLAALSRLPVDQLKLDRSFISAFDRDDDPAARPIVTAIMELANALGLATIAEGVETTAQREILRSLGCKAIQGHHEARPMPLADALHYLRHRPVANTDRWGGTIERAGYGVGQPADVS